MSTIEDLREMVVSRIQECEKRKAKGEYLDPSALQGYIIALRRMLGRIDFIIWSKE